MVASKTLGRGSVVTVIDGIVASQVGAYVAVIEDVFADPKHARNTVFSVHSV